MRINQKILYLLLLGLVIFSIIGLNFRVEAALVRIQIPETVTINDDWIKLGDIAWFAVDNQGERDKLASLILGRAMLPGYTRTISRDFLLLTLKQKGFLTDQTEVMIPDRIKVVTASKTITSEMMIKFAIDYIKQSLNMPAERVQVKANFSPPDLTIADQDYYFQVEQTGQEIKPGNISLKLQIMVDNEVYKRVFLGFKVSVLKKVFVAKHNLPPGSKISQADFKEELREPGLIRGSLITDFHNELVLNGVVGISIPAGGILSSYYLKRPDIIDYGDIVKAEYSSGNLVVSTIVKALQSGKKGDYIRVENQKTGYRFQVKVINSKLVQVIR